MSLTIHTKELVKSYRSRTVVNNVSIEVNQGEIVGLLGPNGAGKTTTFYMVVGLIKPDEGEVYLGDKNITSLAMYKRAQMGIGYLPQETSVFRKLSVEDNISAILEMTKLSRHQQKEKLESLLDEFRLQHVRKSNGDVLSGGERRRTEIARALAVDPKFILLDEPFAGIDPIAVEDIQAIVAKLKHKNIGILITDHNVTETLSICDRAYLLIEGKIFKHGTAEELADDEQVRRLYLGRNFELKRKDYLLEDYQKASSPKLDDIIVSIELALSWQGQFEEDAQTGDHLQANQYAGAAEKTVPAEYVNLLLDIRSAIGEYAQGTNDAELLLKTDKLQVHPGSFKEAATDLKSILFFLKSKQEA